jgi:hypothetical protein
VSNLRWFSLLIRGNQVQALRLWIVEQFSGYLQEISFLLATSLDDAGQNRMCVRTWIAAVSSRDLAHDLGWSDALFSNIVGGIHLVYVEESQQMATLFGQQLDQFRYLWVVAFVGQHAVHSGLYLAACHPIAVRRHLGLASLQLDRLAQQMGHLVADRPATYQIKVPGELDEIWSDWAEGMTMTVESEGEDPPVTTLTGDFDQAALQGLLRRFYSLGLPLISVICVDCCYQRFTHSSEQSCASDSTEA